MKVFDFINHASIKCNYGDLTIVTDPWYISNAFGSWYQSPSPNKNDIFNLIDTDEKLGVVISHGHDDHIDDWFIRQHLKNKTFFCSKFKTPGLEKRLVNKLGVKTRPIGAEEKFGEFTFHQFVNPDFTENDAVITIETPDFLIIHANDNWHKWPKQMTEDIKMISDKYDEENIFFLIQFGIADCFPLNYVGTTENEARTIINSRYEKYLDSTEQNMLSLKLKHMYYYANQSFFTYKECNLNGHSMYQMAQQFLSAKGKEYYTQLEPGMTIYKGHKNTKSSSNQSDIFRYCLDSFENFINENYKKISDSEKYIKVRFRTPDDEISKNEINYIASKEVWNRIIIGEITLESIIIGGIGVINKPDINIRDHHHFVSKRAYMAQNMIQKKGLDFFREFGS